MKKTFGQNLQSLMKEKRLSGRALASEVGVSYKTLNEWCGTGGRIPRDPEVVKRLANHFEVSVHFLLFGHEDERSIAGRSPHDAEIPSGKYEITIRKINSK